MAKRNGKAKAGAWPFEVQVNGGPAEAPAYRFHAPDFDALEPQGRRKMPNPRVRHLDAVLPQDKRNKLTATSQNLSRNFSIAQWMIKKHLDYVTQFEFDMQTSDRGLNRDIEALMLRDSRPSLADTGGRFWRERLFRLAELRAIVDGDMGLMKLANGRLQGIESDLVQNPPQEIRDRSRRIWVNGVLTAPGGRHLAYSVYKRGDRGYEFDRVVPAANMCWYGHYEHFSATQTRGVSPIVSALAPLRDVYENFNYALAKAKVTQLFAIAFYREAQESAGELTYAGDEDDCETDKSGYTVDFGKGPAVLDLEPGDRAEFLEANQPGSDFQNFTELMIQVALKALDIPYSFYNESFTNFFGSRAAWLHYQRSCFDKQQNQRELRRQYTIWKFQTWILSGELVLPSSMSTLEDLVFEWIPRGMPWWDPSKEVNGDIQAVASGFTSPQRVVKEHGTGTFEDNVDQLVQAIKYAEDKGQEVLGRPLALNFTPLQPVISGDDE